MGNKLDPSFVVASVNITKGVITIKQARTFDARVDARIFAAYKNKNRRAGSGKWRVITTTPGPTDRK